MSMRRSIPAEEQRKVNDFNRLYPVGTVLRYWRGEKRGESSGAGRSYAAANVLSGHTAVVWIEGCSGCIALSHVEPVAPCESLAIPEHGAARQPEARSGLHQRKVDA